MISLCKQLQTGMVIRLGTRDELLRGLGVRLMPVLLAVSLLLAQTVCGLAQAAQPAPAAPGQQALPAGSSVPAPVAPAAGAGAPPPAGGTAASTTPATSPAASSVPAAPLLPAEITDPVSRLAKSIEGAEKSIQQLKELEGELSRLRGDVERIIYDSTATAESLRPQLAELKSQIEKLGPAPASGQPPETPTVASERLRLNAMAGALDSAVKTTELAWVRAKQLIDRITVMRYQLFTRNLFERRDSPVLPAVWRDVNARMDGVIGRLRYYGGDWMGWANIRSRQLMLLGLAAVALFAGLSVLIRRLTLTRLARPAVPPGFFDRVIQGAWMAPARAVPGVATALLVYFGLDYLDLLYNHWAAPGLTALQGSLVYVASAAMLAVAFAPKFPSWRLIPVSDRTARRLVWILKAFVAIYVLDTLLIELGRLIYVPLTVTIAQSFLTSLLFAGLLATLLLIPFEPQIGADRPVNGHVYVAGPVSRHTPLWIKLPLWAVALTILIASMLGYIALGRFVAHQLVLSGLVIAVAGIGYLAIRAAARGRADGRHVIGEMLQTRFGLDVPRQRQLARLSEVVLTATLLTAAVPILLLQWGFASADIRDWFKAAVFGFEIGHLRISIARILLGIVLFMGLLFFTRLLQKWLREGVLDASRMDAGISNSIDQAVGYAGIALAALLAVSYAGFDITSLAIVAGALSVGIGFGLQSIVNNFVSGLILLVERPIKVGDWVVVGDQQGNVRRISVRSTEIETFEKASLILPNSELISGRVLNWTHRNLLGRVSIKFTLDGNADPERVIGIMLACAKANAKVLQTPEPLATLDQFSPSALDFSLRATLADITHRTPVLTELRIAILADLRKAGQILVTPPQVPTIASAPAFPAIAS